MAKLDERGREILDDTPVSIPMKIKKPASEYESIRDAIRREMSIQAADQGNETFEEADDFDVGDDYDPSSPYEIHFDPEMALGEPTMIEETPEPQSTDPEPDPQISGVQDPVAPEGEA